MNVTVRNYLIDKAGQRTNQTITYQRLCDACGLRLDMRNQNDRNAIADILTEISTFEHGNSRPMLSSLVLRAGDNYEGDGFFTLAEKLGYGDRNRLKREGVFDIKQINACLEFWQNDSNYVTFR